MSVNSKMTAIADEIRELSGTTGAMGLDAMAEHVGEANIEVDGQADLIAQIASALEGKVSGGSGSEGTTNAGTFTLKIIPTEGRIYCITYIYYFSNGMPCVWEFEGIPLDVITIENIDVNSYIIISGDILDSGRQMFSIEDISSNLVVYGYDAIFYGTQADTIETIAIMPY